jgi:ribosome-associated protein
MPEMLTVNSRIQIPLAELEFSFARSSGPGGQNVNKVNSKAQLRWTVGKTCALSDEVRTRLLSQLAGKLTVEGDLLIVSQRYRDQGRNVEDCLEKLRELVARAAVRPVKRRPTKPSRAAKQRRLESKKENSLKKQGRQKPREE